VVVTKQITLDEAGLSAAARIGSITWSLSRGKASKSSLHVQGGMGITREHYVSP
jgi:hypothetical protein